MTAPPAGTGSEPCYALARGSKAAWGQRMEIAVAYGAVVRDA